MKKKIIALGLVLCMSITSGTSYGAGLIDESNYALKVGQGLTLKKSKVFYEWGVQSFNILEMDAKDPALKLDLLFNQAGFSQRLSLSNMATQDPQVIAAVNGDFFSVSNPGFSIGPMVKEGKSLSNGHYDINKFASFLMDHSGNPVLTYVYPGVRVENQTKGNVTDIAAINKPSKNYGNIVILTKEYMKNSPGASTTYFDLTEVVVENNVVSEVRFGQPSVPIPENGYVMVAGGANSYVLSANFAVGDQVNLQTDLSLSYPNTRLAMGGGTMLIKDGVATPLTQTVKGNSQRTALAITKDQKILLITVDGRKSPYVGMEEKDMQNYLLGLGVKDAMMLDGGGSTQMIADGKIQNDMTSGERALVNGLAIKSNVPAGSIASIDLAVYADVIFQGDKVEVAVRGKDSLGAPVHMITPNFQVTGEGVTGTFDGRYFTFTSAGKGAVVANYGGVIGKKEVNVLAKGASDGRYRPQGSGNILATILPDMSSSGDSVLDEAIKGKLLSLLGQSPLVITAGNQDTIFQKGISAPKEAFNGAYKSKTIGDTTYISIDNRNGGIYKVAGQWDYLKGLLQGAGNNIIILLQGSDKSGDSMDQKAIDKIIQTAAESKNIYVVYKDKNFVSRMDGRVSYIGVADYRTMPQNGVADFKYLEFNLDNGTLTYTFKNIF